MIDLYIVNSNYDESYNQLDGFIFCSWLMIYLKRGRWAASWDQQACIRLISYGGQSAEMEPR